MNPHPRSAAEALELFIELRRRGERVEPAVFAARFPEHADELVSAIDALLMLEDSTLESVSDAVVPAQIGPYRVVREIGRGGMGVVLEAVEEPLGRRVALKILPQEHLASATARERFRREAKLASQLDHSGIATIFGAGVDAEEPWIAMRFVEGESLAHKIAVARDEEFECVQLDASHASGRESALRIAGCLAGVARALQFAHERGILHRDVKPSNVLITPEGAPVLLDFGLAIGTESDGPTLTRTGQTAGTPAYLAPELISGERARPDAQCDLYALGVTLYECLTLRRPFEGPTQVALYRAIISGTPSNVRTLNHDIPRDLAVVVATAMERDPARRYRSAAALASDLEACAAGRPILARPLPLHGRVLRWARREPRQAALVSLLGIAVLGLALFGGSWWSSRERVLAADRMDRERQYETDLQDGYADLATRKVASADRYFQHALTLRPDSIEALVGRAVVCIDDKRDAEATALLANAPDSPALNALRAVVKFESPPLDLGNAWLSEATSIELFVDGLRISKQGDRAPRHERKSYYVLAAGRFAEAVNRSPGARAFFHVKRALTARDAGDESAARSSAAALATLWPSSARALFIAGNAIRKWDVQAAIRLLLRSIALDPSWGPPHQNLANAYFSVKEYEQSVAELREAIRIDPRDADAYNSLGRAYWALECMDDARASFSRATLIRPDMFEAWANLGVLENDLKNFDAAEPALRQSLELAPYEPKPRTLLAAILNQRNDLDEALSQFELLVGLTPKDADAWVGLSSTLIKLDRLEEGLQAAEVGLELAPGNQACIFFRDRAQKKLAEREAVR